MLEQEQVVNVFIVLGHATAVSAGRTWKCEPRSRKQKTPSEGYRSAIRKVFPRQGQPQLIPHKGQQFWARQAGLRFYVPRSRSAAVLLVLLCSCPLGLVYKVQNLNVSHLPKAFLIQGPHLQGPAMHTHEESVQCEAVVLVGFE